MLKNEARLASIAVAWVVVATLACSTQANKPDGTQATSPPVPSAETSFVAETPTEPEPEFLEDCYGLETGDVGVEECDRWVKAATRCATAQEHGDAFLATTRQKRLTWKLAAKKASDDQGARKLLREQCRKALENLDPLLKEQGCEGSKK
jgi:hypothetical protein